MLVREAAGRGAQLVLMPENVVMIPSHGCSPNNESDTSGSDVACEVLKAFRLLAMELRLWLHCGTLMVRQTSKGLVANRTYVLRPDGATAAYYDKIHMFDVDLGNGEIYSESSVSIPGNQATVVCTPWGGLGLSVCYDLRFPQLYRALAQAGASFLAVPSAFTYKTGVAHWHVLLRARAIENGCYVFAPAQTGIYANSRLTYGHSLIVDPWGKILADAGEAPGLIVAEVDPGRVQLARNNIPSLRQDRPFSLAIS